MAKKTITLLLIFFIGIYIFGQTTEVNYSIPQDFSPTSPDVAAIGKYGMQPPDLSKGLPSVSIPFFTIEESGISFPIAINYSYSGYRPKEEASWVGLGWTISADAIITRMVKGVPDNASHLLRKFDEFDQTDFESFINDQEFYTEYNGTRINLTANRVLKGFNDGQPDVFIYNFNGYSGRFIYTNNKAICFPKNDLIIEKTDEDNFIIQTPEGLKYTFDHSEVSDAWNYSDNEITYSKVRVQHTTAWRLKRIENCFTNAWVEFSYTDYTIAEMDPLIVVNSKTFYSDRNSQYGLSAPLHFESPMVNYNSTFTKSQYLSKIESNNLIVDFIPGDRLDYPHSKALKEINVYDKRRPGYRIKRIVLNNDDYFGSTDNQNTCILKLSQVFEYGETDSEPKIHDFSYDFQGVVDKKLSCALDHWGYYNGQHNNKNLIPLTPEIENYQNEMFSGGYIGANFDDWANRSSNFTTAKKNALTKIVYPTGGTTQFFYQSAGGRGIRLEKITDSDGQQSLSKYYTYFPDQTIDAPQYKSYYSEELTYDPNNPQLTSGVYCPACNSISVDIHAMRYLTVTGGAKTTFNFVDENTNYYSRVTEKNGANGEGGTTVYTFQKILNDPSQRALPCKTSYYRFGDEDPFREEENIYLSPVTNTVYFWNEPVETLKGGVMPCAFTANPNSGCDWPSPVDPNYQNVFLGGVNNIIGFMYQYWHQLDKKNVTNDGVITTYNYTYHPQPASHSKPISETTENSDESTIRSYFYYPGDGGYGIDEMWDETNSNFKYAKGYLVKLDKFRDQNKIFSFQKNYIYDSDKKLLLLENVKEFPTGTEECVVWGYNYDNDGNTIQVQKQNNLPTSYLWGYNNSLPVVKIVGIDYASIPSNVKNSIEEYHFTGNTKEDVAQLKTALSDILTSDDFDCMVTFYTYSPLYGITSQTTPNGITTYYEYDKFGRLLRTVDNDENIIQEYEYHLIERE